MIVLSTAGISTRASPQTHPRGAPFALNCVPRVETRVEIGAAGGPHAGRMLAVGLVHGEGWAQLGPFLGVDAARQLDRGRFARLAQTASSR